MRRRRKVWIDGRLDFYQVAGKVGKHEHSVVHGVDIISEFGTPMSASVGDTIRAMIEKNRRRIETTPSWFGLAFDDTPDSDGNPYWDR